MNPRKYNFAMNDPFDMDADIKLVLPKMMSSINFIQNVITQLDNRVKTMNNDILKIDQEVSEQLGLPVDTDRIARADGKVDARKD